MYLLFGSVIQSWTGWFVNALGGTITKLWYWSFHPRKKKKKRVSHRERRAKAKARVRKFRRRALAVALVLRCRRRPCNKPPRLVSLVPKSEPVRWKWKQRNAVGLDSVISRLDPSTLHSFCTGNHDFLWLPKLMGTLCNYDYHVQQIKLALD